MWNCQKCNAEVDDGFEVCWSCGTTIDGREDPHFVRGDADSAPAASEMSPAIATAEALVTIASPALPEHAHVLRCHLEAAGIGVFIADEPVDGFDWLLHRGADPIHLQVREIDADRAKAILAEIPVEEKAPPAEQTVAEQPAVAPPTPSAPAVWEPSNKASLDPQEYVRVLESKLSSLMDNHDAPGWKVNPAFHPEVTAFIQAHANNAVFLKKAQSMQQNRAKYFGTIRQQALTKAADEAAEAAAAAAQADAPMCTEVTADMPKPRLRFRVPRSLVRLAKWTAILLVLAVIGVYLAATTYRQIGERELEEAIARIDETDPGWRWNDLQAKRAQVPDKENAALKVMAVARLLPEDWKEANALVKEIGGLKPGTPLNAAQYDRLRETLDKHQAALVEARTLADFSTGRYPQPSGPSDIVSLDISYLKQPVSAVLSLLIFDTTLRTFTEKNADGALASARALLATGRSVGDEPMMLAQLLRRAGRNRACLAAECALAQAQGSESALQTTQKLWQDEAAQPFLVHALKGERAYFQEIHEGTDTYGPDYIQLDGNLDRLDTSCQYKFQHWLNMGRLKENHALALDLLTEAVALAKLPVEQQVPEVDKLDAKWKRKRAEEWPQGRYGLGVLPMVGVIEAARRFHRSDAQLRSTIAALAAERYRLANDQWPDSLDALVPNYLAKVPTDPYDGKPLRMRKLEDGLVIYSIGPDREDNQGTLDRKAHDLKGKDIGFRLWDVERRRQAAEPSR